MPKKIVAVIVDYQTKSKPLPNTMTVIMDNTINNRGFARGVNIGIKKALKLGAEKILLVNPDLKINIREIRAMGEIGDIESPILETNGILDFGGRVNWILGRTTHRRTGGRIDYVSGACMLIDRKVFEKIGMFDEQFFMYFEDVDFCLRAKAAGFKVAVNPNVIIHHGLTKSKIKNNLCWESNVKFVQKWTPWYFKLTSYGYLFLLFSFLRHDKNRNPRR